MEHIYAAGSAEELMEYQAFARQNQDRLDAYIAHLTKEYAVKELPRAILWTSREAATRLLSDIPVPAYTNDFRIVFDPRPEDWRDIYLAQLDSLPDTEAVRRLRQYYESLSLNHVLQILGHELAHHSEWFLDDFDDEPAGDMWFEEGMAEYISRRYFLTEAEFAQEAEINRLLVDLLEETYGGAGLDDFGAAACAQDYAGIFFAYWRSFLAVDQLIRRQGGDVGAVFEAYHRWHSGPRTQTLAQYFGLCPPGRKQCGGTAGALGSAGQIRAR